MLILSIGILPIAVSQPSPTVKNSHAKSWFERNSVVAGVAAAAFIVAGGFKLWGNNNNSTAIVPVALPANIAQPDIFAPIALNQPFRYKQEELDLYNYFGVTTRLSGNWVDELNKKLVSLQYPSRSIKSDSNYLFDAYPALLHKIPYIRLAEVPTPVLKLTKLSTQATIYLKNDALTGGTDATGKPLYGGNKVRKLGYLLAEARALGAKKVLTFGCVGSNHAVATAVHASRAGMEQVICMLKHQPPSQVVQQNLLTHLKYGSELHYSPNNDIRKISVLSTWLEHYKKDGQAPYIIPTGGSNMIGALGFVTAGFELAAQIKAGIMPMPTHIYVPTGSCGTTAGLLLGCIASGITAQIVAVAVEPDEDPTFAQNIDKLFKDMNKYLHELDNTFPIYSYSEKNLRIDLNFAGPDYGVFTPEGLQAAQLLEKNEAIKLEGTYTAKGFAGMLHDIKNIPNATVLFWNTYCGLDFSEQLNGLDYRNLPRVFHDYFDNNNLQPLAQKKQEPSEEMRDE